MQKNINSILKEFIVNVNLNKMQDARENLKSAIDLKLQEKQEKISKEIK